MSDIFNIIERKSSAKTRMAVHRTIINEVPERLWFWQKIYREMKQVLEAFFGIRIFDIESEESHKLSSDVSNRTKAQSESNGVREEVLSRSEFEEECLTIERMLNPSFPLIFIMNATGGQFEPEITEIPGIIGSEVKNGISADEDNHGSIEDIDHASGQKVVEEMERDQSSSYHSDDSDDSSPEKNRINFEKAEDILSEKDSNNSRDVFDSKVVNKKSLIPRLVQRSPELTVKSDNEKESQPNDFGHQMSLHEKEDLICAKYMTLRKAKPNRLKKRTISITDIKAAIVAKKRVQCPHCKRSFDPKTCDVLKHILFCEDIHKRIDWKDRRKDKNNKSGHSTRECDQQRTRFGFIECRHCGRSFSQRMYDFSQHLRRCSSRRGPTLF